MRRVRHTIALVFLVAILPIVTFATARAERVRVFAAASLTEAFDEIGAIYREQNPGDALEIHYAGSQVLRTQIEEGAPADLFAPADHAQMDALEKRGLTGPRAVFARNRLVIVTPRAGAKVRALADLARPGVRVVLADRNVPAGRYTAQMLGNAGRAGTLGDDFAARVTANVVSHETNVRAVLAKVALGEVDGGVVYATDARSFSEKIAVVAVPDSVNVVAEYPVAIVGPSASKESAARFVALLLGDAGRAILAKHGFDVAR